MRIDDALKTKLASELLPATWATLGPHAKRGGLFLVSERAPIVEVAYAVATDDSDAVKAWIEDRTIRRPTQAEMDRWESDPVAFEAIIVQPYVLCRPLAVTA